MKKIKIFFSSFVAVVVCLQLVGAFNLARAYAAEEPDFVSDQNPPQQFQNNETNPSDAQEEGATDILDNQNPPLEDQPNNTSQTSLGTVDLTEQPQFPEVKPVPAPKAVPKNLMLGPVPQTPNVVINEFMANPEGADSGNEWVELYNNELTPIDLAGWKIKDLAGNSHTINAQSTIINSKSFYLINGLSDLNNTDDETIQLLDQNLNQVDVYNYNGAASGITQGRYPDGSSSLMQLGYPTPGTANYLRPFTGTVDDGSNLGVDLDFSNNNTQLLANWSGFYDIPQFAIASYKYAFGTAPGDDDIIPWASTLNTFAQEPFNLTENETYYASVIAINDQGIESDMVSSDGVTVDTLAPVNYDTVIFSADGSPITVGSEVYIEIQPGEAGVQVDGYFNSKKLNWKMDIDQLKHGPFYYAVYTVEKGDLQTKNGELLFALTDEAGNTSQLFNYYSNVEIDTEAPIAPSSIAVIAGSKSIKINWAASSSGDIAGYNIYRSSSPYVKLNQNLLPANQTTYTDSNVDDNVTYHYKVTAVDFAGNETELASSSASQAIAITAISKVAGQILDEGIKTYNPEPSLITHTQAKSKVKGEKVAAGESQNQTPPNDIEDATNWPMIIALGLAALIILSGIWYYWAVTKNIEPEKAAKVARTRKKRVSSKKVSSRKPRRGRPSGRRGRSTRRR